MLIHSLNVLLKYNRKRIENMPTRHFKVEIVDLMLVKKSLKTVMDAIK